MTEHEQELIAFSEQWEKLFDAAKTLHSSQLSILVEAAERWVKTSEESGPIDHPKHYTSHPSGFECIQIARWFGFNLGNVIKYLWRAPLKGASVEDLRKAAWYLADEIRMMERGR